MLNFFKSSDAIRGLLYLLGGSLGVDVSQDQATTLIGAVLALSGAIKVVGEIVASYRKAK